MSLKIGWSFSISSVIWLTALASSGITISGFISTLKREIIPSLLNFTAPISTTLFSSGLNPVVSVSKATNVALSYTTDIQS